MEWLICWLAFVIIATLAGAARGQGPSGFLWGFLLGPLGLLIVLFLPNKVREAERLEEKADDARRNRLLEQTLRAQERQLQLLQTMVNQRHGGAVQVEAAAQTHSQPEPQSQREPEARLEDFIPESMRQPSFRKANVGEAETVAGWLAVGFVAIIVAVALLISLLGSR